MRSTTLQKIAVPGFGRKSTRLMLALAAALAMFGTAAVFARPAPASAALVVEFQRLGTTLCITENVAGNPQLFEGICNAGNPRQRFIWFTQAGHTGAKFVPQSVATNCLNVAGSSKAAGAKIVLSDCASDLSQDWFITSTPLLGFLIENANSRLCITRTSVAFVQQPCSQSLPTQNFALNSV